VDRKEPEHTARYGYYDRKADRNGICTGRNRRLGTWTIAPRQPLTDIFGQAFLGTCSPLLRTMPIVSPQLLYLFPIVRIGKRERIDREWIEKSRTKSEAGTSDTRTAAKKKRTLQKDNPKRRGTKVRTNL